MLAADMMNERYDYVIVGAGSAGCVLAARLSEDPNVRVALLEAGGRDDAVEINVPVLFTSLFKTIYDWDFSSEPEPALGNRRLYVPRGRGLGGSSSINAMVHLRGNRADFDDWASRGATGWSYRDLLPYFIKSESASGGDDAFHGRKGPLSVQDGRALSPLVDRILEAAVDAGHSRNDDFNGTSQIGVGRYQVTQRDGARCSASRAYLQPAEGRANLHIFTETLVTRILFNGVRACGVSARHGQVERVFHADREIILSAGAIGSPQILMLSGIGVAAEIAPHGIAPLIDLPVGRNLQDHPCVFISAFTGETTLFSAGSTDNISLYESEQRGPMSSNIAEGGGFVATHGGDIPDIQLLMGATLFLDEGLTRASEDGFGIGSALLKPSSRGSVTLRSGRPDAKPHIRNNYLTTPEDREIMIAGVQICLDIIGKPILRGVTCSPQQTPASRSASDIWKFVQRNVTSIWHPTSTCSIGTVVDNELRVMGLERLRVVDASVMPTIVRANTNAAVVAIAEKAADMIGGGLASNSTPDTAGQVADH